MKRSSESTSIYSPSDLIRYLASPFASWMDRLYFEQPGTVTPDKETEDQILIARTGDEHELAILEGFVALESGLVQIPRKNPAVALERTLAALSNRAPIIFQAALEHGEFAGYADFLLVDEDGRYQVWDTKLARSPKPYYAIQLCCYSEMLAAVTGSPMAERFGIILGTKEKVEFRVEDFIHYYRRIKASFLAMHHAFTGELDERPEPHPRADHGRWSSHATAFFTQTDHLVQVAGISVGQIKKLKKAGIATLADLADSSGRSVPKLAQESLRKLASQANLQLRTRLRRVQIPDAPPIYEVLSHIGPNGEPKGLACLPAEQGADVFFDMEGYPLAPGGLEYLFGVWTLDGQPNQFLDWWAHDREEEKLAFEGFVDWVYDRWTKHPGMHIYHYAAYEVSAVRRLSTFHDTRQEEVDVLLRNEAFVDLYQIVRQGLRIGEDSYSIKSVEHLYGLQRAADVGTAISSIVHYARWIESKEPREWNASPVLKGIRDYNEEDCRSTAELVEWLRGVAAERRIVPFESNNDLAAAVSTPPPDVAARLELAEKLRARGDEVSIVLGDLIDFHRREEKSLHWRMFDRATMTVDELRDDPSCVGGIQAAGSPTPEARSLIQKYRFDPAQECKLRAGDTVMFPYRLDAKFTLIAIDIAGGELQIKIGNISLSNKFGGDFPEGGSLIPYEVVPAKAIQAALLDICGAYLSGDIYPPVAALLQRVPPTMPIQAQSESSADAAIRVAESLPGGCFVIQGPPGTGKTYTASRMIAALLASGKKVGIASNGRKAVVNLLAECGRAARANGAGLTGIMVGGDDGQPLFTENPGLLHVEKNGDGYGEYSGGVAAGTAWLFSLPEWQRALDYLFIDEAGQVSLANAVAMARCAKNLILLGDQMQLEQPVQGAHPRDSGLSVLQYALKDTEASSPDRPIFHAVVPPDYGLFLGESRRMHPSVCRFISESIYEGRLTSHPDCARQRIAVPPSSRGLVGLESGILFSGVEHDGNTQRSEEEVDRVRSIYEELLGREYTATDGSTRPLALGDFLFIAPYNSQVRALQAALPDGARVGSVDRLQGQEAPVCTLSLCSSYGEYGSRGLKFILDRNRVNVAISRAKCIAVVVADPRIAATDAGSLAEMGLLNLFCKFARDSSLSRGSQLATQNESSPSQTQPGGLTLGLA